MTRRRVPGNSSGDTRGAPTGPASELFLVFDELEPRLKRALWESSLNIGPAEPVYSWEVPEFFRQLRLLEARELVKVWGRDHPQAGRPLEPVRRKIRRSPVYRASAAE